MMATSVTVLAIGPAVSWLAAIGMMPFWDTSPTVGLSPTMLLFPAGEVIEPSVSVPIAAAHRLAAAPTAEPLLEPEGSASSTYGLRVKPPRPLQPLRGGKSALPPRKLAHSERFALPRITAPAWRSRAMILASAGTFDPSSANEPAVVSMRSAVATLSFTRIGMPCSGPRTRPRRRSSSSSCASWRAAGLVWRTAWSCGFSRSIRLRYQRVRSRLFVAPLAMACWRSVMVASDHPSSSATSAAEARRSHHGAATTRPAAAAPAPALRKCRRLQLRGAPGTRSVWSIRRSLRAVRSP